MLKKLLSLVSLWIPLFLYAQGVTISGYTYDGLTQTGLANCRVSIKTSTMDTLLAQVTTVLQTERTEENGNVFVYQNTQIGALFMLQFNAPISAQAYHLVIEKEGYESIEKIISAKSLQKERLDLGDFYLFPKRKDKILGEAVVKATKIKMYYKGDTLVYNAGAFNVSQMDKLKSLVAQLPGTELKDGVLKVNGRPIENLMLSGKDFFNGNIQAALDNLPAYVVSKIKVYEKAGDMSELTGRNMHDKSYVMDVKLKREYIGTWIAKLQADGGTSRLWGSQGMLMRMDDRQMFTANFDANNLNEKREMSEMGDGADLFLAGRFKRWNAKVNYFYEPNRYWRFRTEAQVERLQSLLNEQSYQQTFFPSKDLFNRSRQQNKERQYTTNAFAAVRYRFKKQQHELQYTFRFGHHRRQSEKIALSWYDSITTQNWATISLDSLYAQEKDKSQTPLLFSLFHPTLSKQVENVHTLSLASIYTLRKNVLKTYLRYQAMTENDTHNENYILTRYTPVSPDWRRNYIKDRSQAQKAEMRAEYIWKVAEKEGNNGELTPYIEYKYNHGDATHSLYRLDWDSHFATYDWFSKLVDISSISDFQASCMDYNNSYNSTLTEHHSAIGTQFNFQHKTEKGNVFDIRATTETSLAHRSLAYLRGGLSHHIQCKSWLFTPNLTLKWEEGNTEDQRWLSSAQILYKGTPRLVNMLHLLPVRDDSDPNNISQGNQHLKNAWEQNLQLLYQSRHRTMQHLWLLEAQWRHVFNDFTFLSAYNSRTGHRIYTPQNTNRTHWLEGATSYAIPLGKAQKLWLTAKLSGDYYQGEILSYIDGTALSQNQLLQSLTITPQLYLTANISSKFRASVLWSTALQSVQQPQATNNYRTTRLRSDFTWQLPWDVELQSDINTLIYKGYSERSINQTAIRWNASLHKYFQLSHGTLSVGFKVYDILHQANSLQTSIDQFSRIENYTNVMPRYALLSLVYMTNWSSKKRSKE